MEKIVEGKTKIVWQDADDATKVIIESKDDLTAGDGAKHDLLAGKAELATATTCNVFRFLEKCGISSAFKKQLSPTEFSAVRCDMVPLEVVIRREAHGSFLKRHPEFSKGKIFRRLRVEFYLKTSGRKWRDLELPKDDMLMQLENHTCRAALYRPDLPFAGSEPFVRITTHPLYQNASAYKDMERLARFVFLALEKAWQMQDRRLVDMKIEFGMTSGGDLILSDVIDNDSWRVLENDQYIDKQVYRDGGGLDEVLDKYRQVSQLTSAFRVPDQRIILWRGSDKDNWQVFKDALRAFVLPDERSLAQVTCSMHKNPERGLRVLDGLLRECPDSVVVAFIGRSNGAGPTLSAHAHVPVITVPANYRDFPDDVWSSLRAPSDVPVMTVLEPKNAMLAALEILALRNPAIYSSLRYRIENRLE